MYMGLHVTYSLFFSDFKKTSVFSTDFEKYSYIQFRENPSNGSGVISCGRTDGRTDVQDGAFRNFATAPKYVLSDSY